jgi:riboflavin synthase
MIKKKQSINLQQIILFDFNKSAIRIQTMFTGIIEAIGTLKNTKSEGTNITFTFTCPFTKELKIDQSLAHNGVCLTVIDIQGNDYSVTAIDETLQKTNIGKLQIGNKVNLERCMPAHGRFDGHIVQGHVDQTGVVKWLMAL